MQMCGNQRSRQRASLAMQSLYPLERVENLQRLCKDGGVIRLIHSAARLSQVVTEATFTYSPAGRMDSGAIGNKGRCNRFGFQINHMN